MQAVTLQIPEAVYQRAKHAADLLRKPLEEVIVDTLETLLPKVPALDEVPEEMRNELAAMAYLSNEALQDLANGIMAAERQQLLHDLLEEQNHGTLTEAGQRELAVLTSEYGRHVLRRAEAAALLVGRGQTPLLKPLPELS